MTNFEKTPAQPTAGKKVVTPKFQPRKTPEQDINKVMSSNPSDDPKSNYKEPELNELLNPAKPKSHINNPTGKKLG